MSHWKHNATRCAMEGCERQRMKGRTTCSLYGHAERGVSLYGLKRDDQHLLPAGCYLCEAAPGQPCSPNCEAVSEVDDLLAYDRANA